MLRIFHSHQVFYIFSLTCYLLPNTKKGPSIVDTVIRKPSLYLLMCVIWKAPSTNFNYSQSIFPHCPKCLLAWFHYRGKVLTNGCPSHSQECSHSQVKCQNAQIIFRQTFLHLILSQVFPISDPVISFRYWLKGKSVSNCDLQQCIHPFTHHKTNLFFLLVLHNIC